MRAHSRGWIVVAFGFPFAGAILLAMTSTSPRPSPETFESGRSVGVRQVSRPSGRRNHGMVYDPVRQVTVVQGGYGVDEDGWAGQQSDTWVWDGEAWKETDSSPWSRRSSHAVAYDFARGRPVLFGGDRGGTNNWQWGEWSGSAWDRIASSLLPPGPRWDTAMASDSSRKRIVLFGGRTEEDLSKWDTWEWDGKEWTELEPRFSPPSRSGHAMAYDVARRRTVLFGGLNCCMKPFKGKLADTWEWNGEDWDYIESPTAPAARAGHAMAYDAVRQRTVLFGGSRDATDPRDRGLSDTWEWDGTVWTEMKPASSPPPRWDHEMVYDSARQRVVLFGGHEGDAPLSGTWEWDGESWIPRTRAVDVPNPRMQAGPRETYDVRTPATHGLDPDLIQHLLLRARSRAQELRYLVSRLQPRGLDERIEYFEALNALEQWQGMATILEEGKAFYSYGTHCEPDYTYLIQWLDWEGERVDLTYPFELTRFASMEETRQKLADLKRLRTAIEEFNETPLSERERKYAGSVEADAILARPPADISHEELVWAHRRSLGFHVDPVTFVAEAR